MEKVGEMVISGDVGRAGRPTPLLRVTEEHAARGRRVTGAQRLFSEALAAEIARLEREHAEQDQSQQGQGT